MLGVAIVRAVDRAGRGGPVQVVGALPSASATASAVASTGGGSTTTTSVIGGSTGSTKDQSAGISAGEIKVGGLFTLSGPGDATVALHAAQAYFNMVNDAGGVYGRKIKYITADDGFDPATGFSETKRLVENEKIFAGSAWVAPNSENQQTIDYLQRKGVPLVGNFGSPPEYTAQISYSFAASWVVSSRLTVRQMANTVGKKKIAMIWVHLSNEIDEIIKENATAEAKRDGAEIVYTEAVDVAKPVYDDTVVNAQQSGADGVITIMDGFSLARYWQSFARATWRPSQVGYAFAMDPQPTAAIPAGYDDVYGIQEMELSVNPTPGITEYLSTMKKYYPGDMDTLSWASELCWLGAKMFVEALRRAGPKPTRQGVMAALDSMTRFDSGLSTPYTIRPGGHDIARCMKAAKLTSTKTWVQSSDWFCL